MTETIVGLDIETTSLNPEKGEIIEIAAIRFNLKTGQEVSRFEALCGAKQPISAETTAITGITSQMVARKPRFEEQIKACKKFLGEDVLFAHNAGFDLSWLRFHGLPLANPVWDTFSLAAAAWPEAESYNLGTLAKQLGIVVEGEHRAAADITLTWQLLQNIRRKLTCSEDAYAHVRHLLAASNQEHYLPLFSPKSKRPVKNTVKRKSASAPQAVELIPEAVFGQGGLLEKNLTGFISRPEQLALAKTLAQSVNSRQSALIEAGPGIGKTYAYLAAGLASNGRFLISTHTRVLQDQLVEKDIPALLEALNLEKNVAILKGRRNYICRQRLRQFMEKKSHSPAQAWAAIKVLIWLEAGGSGDMERLNLSHQGAPAILRLASEPTSCRHGCEEGTCPYQRARQHAETADITVINHALLLSIVAGEENLHHHYQLMVVDEAHQLEKAALSASESDLSREHVQHLLERLQARIPHEKVRDECQALLAEFDQLEGKGKILLNRHTVENRLRLTAAIRRSQGFQSFRQAAENYLGRLSFLLGLARSQESKVKRSDFKLYAEAISQAERFHLQLQQFIAPSSQDRVQWLEASPPSEEVFLKDSAINIAPYVSACLAMIQPTVAISGTLTTGTSFSYIKTRFGIESWPEFQFPSAFNYFEQMRILVVEDGPLPGEQRFDQFVAQVIDNITHKTQGRLLSLFTSHESLKSVHGMLRNVINKEKVRLLSQKMTGGRHNIAKRFRDDHASILLGTNSFWEGFDSPGETLSVLVIPRLPFPQPTDPIIEAMSDRAGIQAFHEVMLPRMTLRLKQGVGRLIRSHSDRGVLVLLDRRLLEKEYGREVLRSLPPTKVEVISHEAVGERVEQYFGPETIARWQATT